jgi:hypothetical protein
MRMQRPLGSLALLLVSLTAWDDEVDDPLRYEDAGRGTDRPRHEGGERARLGRGAQCRRRIGLPAALGAD